MWCKMSTNWHIWNEIIHWQYIFLVITRNKTLHCFQFIYAYMHANNDYYWWQNNQCNHHVVNEYTMRMTIQSVNQSISLLSSPSGQKKIEILFLSLLWCASFGFDLWTLGTLNKLNIWGFRCFPLDWKCSKFEQQILCPNYIYFLLRNICYSFVELHRTLLDLIWTK